MGKSRYIKDDKGVTMSVTTSTLGLEKPLLNENYNIDVHNRNMDKIDEDLTPIDDSYIIELFQHDGDTSRPRDYYTKEESDLKYATKEEVENIDLSNLATKEEVNNALNKANEAFQRGDNVKTQLVDKLISEGLDVSTNNTFEELIGSIALGKKIAIGYIGAPTAYEKVNENGDTQFYLHIRGLDFKPQRVAIVPNIGNNNYLPSTSFLYYDGINSLDQKFVKVYQGSNQIAAIGQKVNNWRLDGQIFDDGFRFWFGYASGSNASGPNGTSSHYTWIAIE